MTEQMNKSDYSKITNFMLNHIGLLILILFQVKSCLCGDCNSESEISDTSTCFNEIIKFSTWDRAGQITVRNDGILLVEFSNGGNRIFYGLNRFSEDLDFALVENDSNFKLEDILQMRHQLRLYIVYLKYRQLVVMLTVDMNPKIC